MSEYIVIDDVLEGTMEIAASIADLRSVPTPIANILEDWEDVVGDLVSLGSITMEKCGELVVDVNVYKISSSKIWAFLESRNATNYLTAV